MLQQARRYIPKPLLNSLRKLKLRYLKSKSAEDVFTDIYLTGKWGKGDTPFFSGEGSVTGSYQEYVTFIQDFIRRYDIKRVVDLG
ncbi:MAG TPA: hypothetical protein VE954_39555 [Oligoflexus sp.]|uniref:hypothetical protein n=1 Tax=Oligoflexus sp. TaxID=1971216 RepID=UPI002D728B7B|nr:hypothetical protein [Oligoflexus sp.]HYX39237.1 hypothetical protein [Oligoflexus sp.]